MPLMLLQLLMNNDVHFVFLLSCFPLDFLTQINNFFILVLFRAVIRTQTRTHTHTHTHTHAHTQKARKKLISKTIKNILDSSSKMQFVLKIFNFFYFLENYQFCQKSVNDANSRAQGAMSFASY